MLPFHHGPGNQNLLHIFLLRKVVHDIQHDFLHDGAQGAGSGFELLGPKGYGFNRLTVKPQFDPLQGKQFFILFDQGILGFEEYSFQIMGGKLLNTVRMGNRPMNSGIMPNLMRSSGSRLSTIAVKTCNSLDMGLIVTQVTLAYPFVDDLFRPT